MALPHRRKAATHRLEEKPGLIWNSGTQENATGQK
jgi:hypothetical protein